MSPAKKATPKSRSSTNPRSTVGKSKLSAMKSTPSGKSRSAVKPQAGKSKDSKKSRSRSVLGKKSCGGLSESRYGSKSKGALKGILKKPSTGRSGTKRSAPSRSVSPVPHKSSKKVQIPARDSAKSSSLPRKSMLDDIPTRYVYKARNVPASRHSVKAKQNSRNAGLTGVPNVSRRISAGPKLPVKLAKTQSSASKAKAAKAATTGKRCRCSSNTRDGKRSRSTSKPNRSRSRSALNVKRG